MSSFRNQCTYTGDRNNAPANCTKKAKRPRVEEHRRTSTAEITDALPEANEEEKHTIPGKLSAHARYLLEQELSIIKTSQKDNADRLRHPAITTTSLSGRYSKPPSRPRMMLARKAPTTAARVLKMIKRHISFSHRLVCQSWLMKASNFRVGLLTCF